jgi:hypothetical protein
MCSLGHKYRDNAGRQLLAGTFIASGCTPFWLERIDVHEHARIRDAAEFTRAIAIVVEYLEVTREIALCAVITTIQPRVVGT